jgi:hypothetical protein
VQQVTSSIVYSSGSNVFGCDLNSRQTFTGSFYQTGSVAIFNSCVGVGTNNLVPGKILTIAGASHFSYGNCTGATFNIEPGANGQDGTSLNLSYWTGTGYGPLKFQLSGTEMMRITNTGNVGIGTCAPNAKLTVCGNEIGCQISFTKDAPNGVYGRIGQDVNGSFITQNAAWNGSSWNRDCTSLVAMALALHNENCQYEFRIAAAGANPITWFSPLRINVSGLATFACGVCMNNNLVVVDGSNSLFAWTTCSIFQPGLYAQICIGSAAAGLYSKMYGSGVNAGIFGKNTQCMGYVGMDGACGKGLLIGNIPATPISIGTANTERLFIAATGESNFSCQICVKEAVYVYGSFPGVKLDRAGTTAQSDINWKDAGTSVWSIGTAVKAVGSNLDFYSYSISDNVLKLSTGGQITTPYQPAFLAYGNSSYGGINTYLIYPTTQFNRGGHYNASTGVFTAPVSGVYYFSWASIGNNTNTIYRFFFRINNSNALSDYQLRQEVTSGGYATNGNRDIVVSLSAGDTARIFYAVDNSSTAPYGANSATDAYLNFMGYLIG